jgi:Holliday junction DNA helicase RuvA
MIGRLRGLLIECGPDRLLIDVGGVGYDAQISLATFYELPDAADQPTIELFIHTHVREDTLQLYGFSAVEERRAFEILIAISGVGPKLALAILSGIGVEELSACVDRKDQARLQRIPGVGKKTAERLMLELRDRLDSLVVGGPAKTAVRPRSDEPAREDAMSALTNLGYSDAVAEKAVDAAVAELGAGAPLEAMIKDSLARLAR